MDPSCALLGSRRSPIVQTASFRPGSSLPDVARWSKWTCNLQDIIELGCLIRRVRHHHLQKTTSAPSTVKPSHCAEERSKGPSIEATGTCWIRPIAEYWKTQPNELFGVPMIAPNYQPRPGCHARASIMVRSPTQLSSLRPSLSTTNTSPG